MNNRDPFRLRSNPLDIIKTGIKSAAQLAVQVPVYTEAVAETLLAPVIAKGSDTSVNSVLASGGMSYAIPRHQHSLSASEHIQAQGSWQSSNPLHEVSERIGGVFTTRNELPMYKDKPYNYTSSRKLPWFRRKWPIIIVLFALIGFVYLYRSLTTAASSKNYRGDTTGVWGLLRGSKIAPIDWDERRRRVKDAFVVSWDAYEAYAWGYDEFNPLSKTGRQMVPSGMGWIIVDALDTLMIMNLTTQLSHAREWISTTLTYNQDHDVNTFETTIRMLGGLLSAHFLSSTFPDMAPISAVELSISEDLYLEKATDLAGRLLGAYESRSGIPFASVNLKTQVGIVSHDDGGASSTAEAATVQLEMKYLAKLTGEKNYWEAAEKIIQVIDDNGMPDGLLPIFIYADLGTFRGENIRLGSRGDSYYEYLIKQYLQTSKEEPIYLTLWNEAMAGVKKHLITYTKHANLTILGERPNGLHEPIFPKMDHLVCFMPGTIALALTEGRTLAEARKLPTWSKSKEHDMDLARQLLATCMAMYKVTATGLSPEIAHFHQSDPPLMMSDAPDVKPPIDLDMDPDAAWRKDFDIHAHDYHNLLRPETVESLFYMWRITGEQRYRDWGWEMFESFVQYAQPANGAGFSSLAHVDQIPPPFKDNMESFWLAETLKYFYLLFGPEDVLPLESVVFNTEAHPMPIFPLGKLFSTGWQRKPRDANGRILQQQDD